MPNLFSKILSSIESLKKIWIEDIKEIEELCSKSKIGKKYTWKPDHPDFRDQKFTVSAPIKLPKSVDLSNINPTVYNQGSLGSCTANSLSGSFDFERIKQNLPPLGPSRLFIYYNERSAEGTISSDAGAAIRDGIKVLASQGVCSEVDWPYNPSIFTNKPNDDCYTKALQNTIKQYIRLDNTNIKQLKTCLAQGYTFVFGFTVYESFESDSVAETGVVPMPDPSESCMGGHAVYCFTGDTKVSLMDSRELSFLELINEFGDKSFWVYSCDENGNIVPGLAHSPRKTLEQQKILVVTLDNGEKIKCTENHLFLLRDGNYKEAENLKKGDSLMPLYRKSDDKGYEMFLNPVDQVYYYTHRKAAFNTYGYYEGVIHHVDFNKKNNCPDNLQPMSWEDHTVLHSKNVKLLNEYAKSENGRNKSRELMKSLWNNPEWRKERLIKNKENGYKTSKMLLEQNRNGFQVIKNNENFLKKCIENGKKNCKYLNTKESQEKASKAFKEKFKTDIDFKNKMAKISSDNFQNYNNKLKSGEIELTENQKNARRINALKNTYKRFHENGGIYNSFEEYFDSKNNQNIINHKVISVEYYGTEDVYDITVEKYHNFALTSGIFVHNCNGYDDDKKAFKVRNSWGEDWGDKGNFWLPYEYITNANLADDFWTIRLI